MTRYMFTACMAAAIAMPSLKAQQTFKDTLYIQDSAAGIKVFIITPNVKTYVKYANPDSLKTMFINDLNTARQKPGFNNEAQVTHYFIAANGKRRIKAEGQEFTEAEINMEKETFEMDNNLPSLRYLIHDLAHGDEYQVYLEKYENLYLLETLGLNKAVKLAAEDKKIYTRTRINLGWKGDMPYNIISYGKKRNYYEVNVFVGAGLVANRWTPMFGLEDNYVFTNKYGQPTDKIGLLMNTYAFAQLDNKDYEFSLSNVARSAITQVRYMHRYGSEIPGNSSNKWFGLQAGVMGFGSRKEGNTRTGFATGISTKWNWLDISYDFIFKKGDKPMSALTLRFSF